jgi:hypothetical protein
MLRINNKYPFTFLVILLISLNAHAQYNKANTSISGNIKQNDALKSESYFTDCAGLALPDVENPPLLLNIKNLERKHSFNKEVEIIKQQKTIEKLKDTLNNSIENPTTSSTIGTNFKGNIFNGGAPPDNTIAVSELGMVVSVINCNIAYYNSIGTQLYTGSFWELFKDPSLTELIFDPVVMYDSQQDRFVLIALHGFNTSTSKLIIAFSKTNNPLNGWWVYKLSGNPLNNNCWLDYPKLGMSNNEVFVTGNLFSDLSGFDQSVIYQINKTDGYAGSTLSWSIWSNIAGNPITIIPASYGQKGNYGPGLYFVNQPPASGNKVELYEITNDQNANPQLIRNTIFKSDYTPSGYALQSGTPVQLITGDCRIQNAFYLDGIIHYVFQSDYQNSNYTGINYNRLNVSSLTNSSFVYGEIGFDCSFPSLASYATNDKDKTIAFCYLRSGASIFPETRTIKFNNNQTWSSSVLVKAGNTFVDAFEFDNYVRWGDYTGIAYRYNSNGAEVWLAGCYGVRQNLLGTNYNCFNTWIAQVSDATMSSIDNKTETLNNIRVWPNPSIDLVNVEFHSMQTDKIQIEILDLSGKVLKTLFNGFTKKGKNLLTFNKDVLPSGTYFLVIKSSHKTLKFEKLIVD